MSRNDYNRMYTRKDSRPEEDVQENKAVDELEQETNVSVDEIEADATATVEPEPKTDPDVTVEPEPVKKDETKNEQKVKKEKTFPAKGKVIGGASLNVRSNPLTTAPIVTTITNGTEVTVEEDGAEFYKISYPATGFVMKKYVEV